MSSAGAEDVAAEATRAVVDTHRLANVPASQPRDSPFLRCVPDGLAEHVRSLIDGNDGAVTGDVSRMWSEFARGEHVWRELCFKRWRALETDKELWKMVHCKSVSSDALNSWHSIYRTVSTRPALTWRLKKKGDFLCNSLAYRVSDRSPDPGILPESIDVERRFNLRDLQTVVSPDAHVFYLEPGEESDLVGFNDFVDYLGGLSRAGLALHSDQRFILVPPCEYARSQLGYAGQSLLCLFQTVHPPLTP